MPRRIATSVLAVLALLAAGNASAGVASGRYIGDGSASRAVTGVGFRPDVVIVKGDSAAVRAVVRTVTMPSSKEMTGAMAATGGWIASLDTDGFTLNGDSRVNQASVTYDWIAFETTPGESRTGSYVGNGWDNRSITGLGFTPSYVIVIPAGAHPAYQRSAAMQESYAFDQTTGEFDHIQRMLADGFEIGDDPDVNLNGSTYHYVAWKAVARKMAVGSFVGLENDNRSITGVGFRPAYVIVKVDDNWSAAHKPVSTGPSSDETLLFNLNDNQGDNIQALRADGFEVGRAERVNSSGRNVFWMAWAAGASQLAVSRGSGTITVETPEVRMVWDAAKGGGLHQFYAKTEAYPTTSRVGSDASYNLFVTALSGVPEAGAGGGLELLEATPTRARVRQKRDFTAAVQMERDWTVYGVPRLGIRETLSFVGSPSVRGETGLHPKGGDCSYGSTFYCAGRSDDTNRIWLATDNRTTYSDVLAIPWTGPFFARGAFASWDSFLEAGTPSTWVARVREWADIQASGTESRSYLLYPNLEGLTSSGPEWQPYATDYRNPSPLAIGEGSPWLDDAENTAPGDAFNESEGAYLLAIDPVAGLDFSMDGSTASPRLRPFFKIRQWRSLNEPATVVLQGTTLVNDRDFTTDLKPVAYAAFCADPGCSVPTKLARGGLVGDLEESLADPARNATLAFSSPGGEYLYVGADARFRGLNVALQVAGSGSPDLRWEYFDGAAWVDLEGVGGFTDLTASFTRSGAIFWGADPPGWASAPAAGGPSLYYVRATLASGTDYSTWPQESQVKTDILLFQYLGSLTSAGRRFVFAPPSSNTRYRSIGTRADYGTAWPDGVGTTVTATLGSTAVTGAGTAWLTANRGRGDRIDIAGVPYTVRAVTADNQLELTEPYAGTSGSGKDYLIARQFPSLAAWEDCVSFAVPCPYFPVASASLVLDNRSEVGVAYGDAAFAGGLDIDGSTTDANHTITLTADHGNRHYGRAWTAGTVARIDNATSGPAIRVRDEHVTVEWLEIRGGTSGGADGIEVSNLLTVNRVVLDSLLVHGTPGSGIEILHPDTVADVYNNVVYQAGVGIRVATTLSGTGQVRVLNNTVFGCNQVPGPRGIVAAAAANPAVTLRNNIAHSNTGDFYVLGLNAASSHNLGSDGSAPGHSPGGGGLDVPVASATSIFLLPASPYDLHLVPGGPAVDVGADLSPVFTADVDAGLRTGPWDVGADELPVASTDIAVTKDDGNDTAVPGGAINYLITLRNNGPMAVSSVQLVDVLPPELESPLFSPSQGTYEPSTGLWDLGGSLGAGGVATLTLQVSVNPAARGTVANTASVGLLQPAGLVDPVPQNNSATDTDDLAPSAALTLQHDDAPDPVALGGVLVYTLRVTNGGLSSATAVVLTDLVPAEMKFEAVATTQGVCTFHEPTRTLTCDLGEVAPGTATVTLTVRPRGLGSFTATASVICTEDPTGASASATTTVQVASDAVQFMTVTSTSGRNVIEWLNPSPADYAGTQLVFRPDGFPTSPTDGTVLYTGGTPGARDRFVHPSSPTTPLTDGQTYYYAVFVLLTAPSYSAGCFVSGRPFDPSESSGHVKWAFSTGGFSVTPPTVGGAGIIATSNDRAVHAMARGAAGGEWPKGATAAEDWHPVRLNGAVQSRSPVVPIPVGGSSSVVFLGAQDGGAYAIDALRGGNASLPWPVWPRIVSPGKPVQAAPAGIFSAFGGAPHDYLLVGTRDPAGGNVLAALDPTDGHVIETFDNAGSGIGIVSGMATVDYATARVYFASRATTAGSPTLWCLQLNSPPSPSVFTPCAGWTSPALGDIDSGPVIRNGRIYVGSATAVAGSGTVYSVDAATGLADRQYDHGDGQVKGFVFPDRNSTDIYFATESYVWGLSDDGSASMTLRFQSSLDPLDPGVKPSSVLFVPGSHYVYAGGSDGRLYELDLAASPPGVKGIPLGGGISVVGAPSLDRENSLVHVGTEAGVFYAVEVPLP